MKVQIIAEIGSVHDGSFGNAMKLTELVKKIGADVIKFQTHLAEYETLPNAPSPKYFNSESRYEYFQRTSFSRTQWDQISRKCNDLKLKFMSSPFSIEAVELLEKCGISSYKVASGEVTNIPLLNVIASTKKHVVLSSGMSSWEELDNAVNTLLKHHNNFSILQCTSEYPCRYENVGMNVMLEIGDRYKLPYGLSDHTITPFASFMAVSLGASIIEKHLTFSRYMYGSDAKHSLEPSEFEYLVSGIRAIELMNEKKVNKDLMVNNLQSMKEIFQKSIVTISNIPKGTKIEESMLGFKKPGLGLAPGRVDEVIGKIARVDIPEGSLIDFSMLE